MTDIASLGIAIDSRAATTAAVALNAFQKSANAAADASDALAGAAKPAAAATAAMDKAAAAATGSSDNLAKSHGGLSTQAMSAQHSIRSLIEAMVSGQPISMALGQQMNHLSYAATGPGGITGAFKEAGGAILGLINPAVAIGAAVVALGAGFALSVNSIVQSGKAFDDVSHSAGTAMNTLQAFANVASSEGVGSSDFLKAYGKFAGDVYDANHALGQLGDLLRANGQSAGSTASAFGKVADLVKNSASDQQRMQILQQAGLPATMDWVRLMQQGSDGIAAATKGFTDMNPEQQKLVDTARDLDKAWSTVITNISTGFKNAILGGVSAMSQLGTFIQNLYLKAGADPKGILKSAMAAGDQGLNKDTDVSKFYTGLGAGAPGNAPAKPTVDPNALQKAISLQQQQISLYGATATAEESSRQVDLAAQQARLAGVSVDQKRIDILKQLAVENNIGTAQIKAQTDADKVAAATVGMSVGQAAEYTAVQNALNDAKRNGKVLTADNVAAIQREGAALGDAAKHADDLNFAFTNLVQGPMETFTSAIAQGATAMDALKQAGQSALNAIAKKLADMAASNLWASAFGGSSGGLMSLLGLGGGGGGNAAAATSATTLSNNSGGAFFGPGFADGGFTGPGGKNQPAGVVHRGEYVMDAATVNRIGVSQLDNLRGFANGGPVGAMPATAGAAQNVHVTVGVSVDDSGNLQAMVKNVSQQTASSTIGSFAQSPQFVDHVAKASKTAKTQRKLT